MKAPKWLTRLDAWLRSLSRRALRRFTVLHVLIGITTFGTMVLALPLFIESEAETAQKMYNVLIFLLIGLGTTVAFWRGLQFEKQRREDRLTGALKMITERDNDRRNLLGTGLLSDMQSSLLPDESEHIRRVACSLLTIWSERQGSYKQLYEMLRATGFSPKEYDQIKDFADKFPIQATATSFFNLLLINTPLPSKRKMLLWAPARESAAAWLAFPFIEMAQIDYFTAENERLTIPRADLRVGQSCCFFFTNRIFNSTLRHVDFHRSIIAAVTFVATNLEGANFKEALLHGSTFGEGTSLMGACFNDTNISGCNFREAKDITPEQFKDAYWIGPQRESVHPPSFPSSWHDDSLWKPFQGKSGQMLNTLADLVEDIRYDQVAPSAPQSQGPTPGTEEGRE